jgi:hypothetical protein
MRKLSQEGGAEAGFVDAAPDSALAHVAVEVAVGAL